MNLKKIWRKQFIEKGYFIGKINPKIIKKLRRESLSLFDTVSQKSIRKKIKNDSDLIKLYNSKEKFVWDAAYAVRLLDPYLFKIALRKEMFEFAKIAGIKKPYFKTPPVSRVDMPYDTQFTYDAHQDYPYSSGSKKAVIIWIPLQDVTTENGALKIVEKSHIGKRLFKTKNAARKDKTLKNAPKNNIILDEYNFTFKDVTLKTGEVLVFDQFLVHKSGYNSSNSVRFSVGFRIHDLLAEDFASQILKEKFSLQKLKNKIK